MTIRRLSSNYRYSPREVLLDLGNWTSGDLEKDMYGAGRVMEGFERQIADLLNVSAARFMPSGTMAQQIALRIWCEEKDNHTVAFHPTAHLHMHEQMGYAELHGMRAVLVGGRYDMMTLAELEAIEEDIAVLLIELPQREIGGYLPTWEELGAMVAWARAKDIRLHLDGARLWESQPFYGRSYAEIAGLFDSVYVSFYKGIGGIAGAILGGSSDFIEQAKIWQRRHGGNLPSMYPYALAAQKGVEDRLHKMPLYHEKAKTIAAALREIPQIRIFPDPPHTHMAHFYLKGDREKLIAAERQVRESHDLILFYGLGEGKLEGYGVFEFVTGDATLDLAVDEIVEAFVALFKLAEG
jgi:threonine aldolase